VCENTIEETEKLHIRGARNDRYEGERDYMRDRERVMLVMTCCCMEVLLLITVCMWYAYGSEAFEVEREEYATRVDSLAGSRKQFHQLKWELHKRTDQVRDLQKSLSDAHTFLYAERDQVLKLYAEIDGLKSMCFNGCAVRLLLWCILLTGAA